MDNSAANSSVVIDGDMEAVWDALTNEDKLVQWYAPGSTWEIPNLIAGGKMRFTLMPSKHNHLTEKLPLSLTIENIIPYQEFSFSVDSQQTRISFVLEEEPNGVRVTANMNFDESLANLKALIEGKELPYV